LIHISRPLWRVLAARPEFAGIFGPIVGRHEAIAAHRRLDRWIRPDIAMKPRVEGTDDDRVGALGSDVLNQQGDVTLEIGRELGRQRRVAGMFVHQQPRA